MARGKYKKRRGVYPHGSGWRYILKHPLTGESLPVNAKLKLFTELGVSLPSSDRITEADVRRLKKAHEQSLLDHLRWLENETPTDLHLSDAIEDFLGAQRNDADYLADQKRVLEEFRDAVGDLPLPVFKRFHIQEFERHLTHGKRERGKLSETTVARYLRYVRKFFNFAVGEEWIGRSPFVNFTMPQDAESKIRSLTLDELDEVVDWIRSNDRTYLVWMIAGFVSLGLRVIELRWLDWENLDLEKRFIKVEKTKTKHSRRMQPIPTSIIPLLKKHRQESGPMFPMESGRRTTESQMNSLRARIQRGFPKFTWGVLRKTYADLLHAHQVDSLIIDRLLGHGAKSSSIRVSATYYIGRQEELYRDIVDEALAPLGEVFLPFGASGPESASCNETQ